MQNSKKMTRTSEQFNQNLLKVVYRWATSFYKGMYIQGPAYEEYSTTTHLWLGSLFLAISLILIIIPHSPTNT